MVIALRSSLVGARCYDEQHTLLPVGPRFMHNATLPFIVIKG